MKRVLYILPFLLFACKKDKTPVSIGSLEGAWRLYEYWNSPGNGPIVWAPATTDKRLKFNADLTFYNSQSDQDHYLLSAYSATDTLVKTYKKGGKDTTYYIVRSKPDTLILHFMGCIEGCSEKFIRPTPGSEAQ